MTKLKLWNTLTGEKNILESLHADEVGIYACGPTVYDYQHIGNYRTYVMVDSLNRVLSAQGYKVKLVINITDVGHLTSDEDEGEDKLEKRAKRDNLEAIDIARKFEELFKSDLAALNILTPDVMPRATEHIPEMIELISKIETQGYTYKIEDGIYFNTSKDETYGTMAKLNLEKQKEGARVVANPEKRNPADFALWKFSTPEDKRQMEWDSPWGRGFPGWHIECSAMSQKYLGVPFDIHAGGIDHIPVHHTNEIAQTKAAYGKMIANYFVHFDFLTVDGRKMARSDETFVTLENIKSKGYSLRALRYLYLSASYSDKINFTWSSLESAANAIKRLDRLAEMSGQPNQSALNQALEIVSDNLAFPKLLAFLEKNNNPWLWKATENLHGLNFEIGKISKELTQAQKDLLGQRNSLRANGDYEGADKIRILLKEQGIELEDSTQGTLIR